MIASNTCRLRSYPAASPCATTAVASRRAFPRRLRRASEGEWNDATHPHEHWQSRKLSVFQLRPLYRTLASLDFVDEDGPVVQGEKIPRATDRWAHDAPSGHLDRIEERPRAVFLADLMCRPARICCPDTWGDGLRPLSMDSLFFVKRAFAHPISKRDTLAFFEHDAAIPAAFITTGTASWACNHA